MFEKLLSALAAFSTIAMFLIEVWRLWKEADSNCQQLDDASSKHNQDR